MVRSHIFIHNLQKGTEPQTGMQLLMSVSSQTHPGHTHAHASTQLNSTSFHTVIFALAWPGCSLVIRDHASVSLTPAFPQLLLLPCFRARTAPPLTLPHAHALAPTHVLAQPEIRERAKMPSTCVPLLTPQPLFLPTLPRTALCPLTSGPFDQSRLAATACPPLACKSISGGTSCTSGCIGAAMWWWYPPPTTGADAAC